MLSVLRRAFWLIGISFLLLVVFLPGYSKLQDLKERNVDLEEKIMRLRRENAFLQQELARIQSDPNYQEKIAREKMGLVRKGEVPIRIVPEQQE
jgi:cell division protein FtsB